MPSDSGEHTEVLNKIGEIVQQSSGGNYIYRGETEDSPKVSSSLYRELEAAGFQEGDVAALQQLDLDEAAGFTDETEPFNILTELQHYGGSTNLIDFTEDLLIALFFACDGSQLADGRVLLLDRTGPMNEFIRKPRNLSNRILAQKKHLRSTTGRLRRTRPYS